MQKFSRFQRTFHVLTLLKCTATAFSFPKNSIYTMIGRTEFEGSTAIIHPPEGTHSASVILMHGLGDSAEGWLDTAEEISRSMPHVKFILPTAETIPVTLNGGMRMPAWYDITGLSPDRASEGCEYIEGSCNRIKQYISNEISLGVLPNRIALAGFSQGGAMSLFCGLQLPIEMKPAGLLVMSGYLPAAKKFKMTPGFEDVKILHCHGTEDQVVAYNWGKLTKTAVENYGVRNYEFKSYPNLGHGANMQELRDVKDYLKSILPEDPSLCIAPKAAEEMSIKELKAAIKNAGLSSKAVGLMEKSEFVKLLNEFRENQK